MTEKPPEPMPPGTSYVAAGMDQTPYAVAQPQAFVQSMPKTLMFLTPMSRNLLVQARQEIVGGNCQFAVVLAQAACELCSEDALIELMALKEIEYLSDAVLGISDTMSLANAKVRVFFTSLSGDDPSKARWWAAWKNARTLRHDVAHKGVPITPEQATLCVDAATAFIDHVTETVTIVRKTGG